MNTIRKTVLVTALLTSALWMKTAIAAEPLLHVVVKMHSIEQIQAQEKAGDELYMSVTEFGPKTRYYRVPDQPFYWRGDSLQKVKDVELFSVDLEPKQKLSLVFSLMEQDVAPWNPDDLLGAVKADLERTAKGMKETWVMPDKQTVFISDSAKGEVHPIEFRTKDARYRAQLSLEFK